MKWRISLQKRPDQWAGLVDPAVVAAALALIPNPYNEDLFLDNVGRRLNREIWSMPWSFPPGSEITGLWKATPKRDYIFISTGAVGVRRIYPLCHEVAHMVLGHKSENTFAGADTLDEVLPRLEVAGRALATRMIVGLMNTDVRLRHDYDTHDERQAENLATTLALAISEPPPSPELGHITRALL